MAKLDSSKPHRLLAWHGGGRKRPVPAEVPPTVAKRYKAVPRWVAEAFVRNAPLYGSQGRAIQVGVELLVRLSRPLKLGAVPTGMIAITYKLTPRTVSQIDALAKLYGQRGQVLAAAAFLLDAQAEVRIA